MGSKQVFASQLTEVTTSAKDTLGDIRYEANKIYKYITYSEEAAAVDGVAGEVVYYLNGVGYDNSDVTSDLSVASEETGAGVLQANMSDNEFGWIQIKGPATLSIALTAGAAGDALTPTGAADGTLDLATNAVTDHICARVAVAATPTIICDFPF
jgi:hypothetical protein